MSDDTACPYPYVPNSRSPLLAPRFEQRLAEQAAYTRGLIVRSDFP